MRSRSGDVAHLAALLCWPQRLVRELQACGLLNGVLTRPVLDTLLEHLLAGVDVTTAYSGLGMPEMAAHLVECELRRMWKGPVKLNGLDFREAWDNKLSAQSILVKLQPHPTHVFCGVEEALGSGGALLNMLLPTLSKDETNKEARREGNWDIAVNAMLELEKTTLWRSGRRCHCKVHDGKCVVDLDPPSKRSPGHRLRVHIAGVICKDFSAANNHKPGFFGPSAKPFLAWALRRRQNLEDVIIMECTAGQQMMGVVFLLGPFYEIHSIVLGPEDGFWPCTRRRKWTIMILRHCAGGRFVWLATLDMFKTLMRFCLGSLTTTGSADAMICWAATEDVVLQDLQVRAAAVAKSSKQEVPDSNIFYSKRTGVRNWGAILPPSKLVGLRLYQHQWLEASGYARSTVQACTEEMIEALVKAEAMKGGHQQLALCDVDHTPGHHHVLDGRRLPCLIGHFTLCSLTGMRRPLLPVEGLLAHGLPVPIFGGSSEEPFAMFPTSTFMDLALPAQEDLVGNSLNAAICGSLIAFVIGTLKPWPDSAVAGFDGECRSEEPVIDRGAQAAADRTALVCGFVQNKRK